MSARRRLPRPVREATKMKMLRVTITAEADRKVRKLAREFRTTPVVVLGLFLKFELARLKQQDSE